MTTRYQLLGQLGLKNRRQYTECHEINKPALRTLRGADAAMKQPPSTLADRWQ